MAIQGAEVVGKNILAFGKGFLREVNKDMDSVRKLLDDRVEANMSLTDHSLKDLAIMGHPYAARAPQSIHSPEYQVHQQTGRLLKAKYSGIEKAEVTGGSLTAAAFVGIHQSEAAHAIPVIYGTWKMVPRDFLRGSLNEVWQQAVDGLRRSLRGAVVSFDGDQVRL